MGREITSYDVDVIGTLAHKYGLPVYRKELFTPTVDEAIEKIGKQSAEKLAEFIYWDTKYIVDGVTVYNTLFMNTWFEVLRESDMRCPVCSRDEVDHEVRVHAWEQEDGSTITKYYCSNRHEWLG